MKRKIQAGTTSLRLRIFVQDSSSTVGAGLTGLAYNTASLTWYYIRDADSATVAVTLATATLGTWATGGFIVVDATHMPGVYEISVPNAAITGSDCVHMMLQGAANMVPVLIEIELDAVNYQSATAFVTGINSIAPPANWNLMSIDGSGRVDIGKFLGTASQGAAGYAGIDWGHINAPTTTVGLTNTTISTGQTIATVTNQLTPAAIATGVWQDATAGDFTVSGSIGKSLFTAGAIPGAAGGLFIAGTNAATTVTTAFTTTFTGNLTGSVASVSGAVGSVTGNVGGNVAGSVGSVTGLTTATIAAAILVTPANLLATDSSGHVVLQPSGLDLVPVESGLNARQSLSIIAAAVAGVGGTSTNIYAGAGVATTRITFAATAGQRSSVTLSPPA